MSAVVSIYAPPADGEPGGKGSLLPDPRSQASWGWFGFKGAMCDRAIAADNAAMLEECLDRDYFEPDAEMFNCQTVRAWCAVHAPSCHAMLQRRVPEAA